MNKKLITTFLLTSTCLVAQQTTECERMLSEIDMVTNKILKLPTKHNGKTITMGDLQNKYNESVRMEVIYKGIHKTYSERRQKEKNNEDIRLYQTLGQLFKGKSRIPARCKIWLKDKYKDPSVAQSKLYQFCEVYKGITSENSYTSMLEYSKKFDQDDVDYSTLTVEKQFPNLATQQINLLREINSTPNYHALNALKGHLIHEFVRSPECEQQDKIRFKCVETLGGSNFAVFKNQINNFTNYIKGEDSLNRNKTMLAAACQDKDIKTQFAKICTNEVVAKAKPYNPPVKKPVKIDENATVANTVLATSVPVAPTPGEPEVPKPEAAKKPNLKPIKGESLSRQTISNRDSIWSGKKHRHFDGYRHRYEDNDVVMNEIKEAAPGIIMSYFGESTRMDNIDFAMKGQVPFLMDRKYHAYQFMYFQEMMFEQQQNAPFFPRPVDFHTTPTNTATNGFDFSRV